MLTALQVEGTKLAKRHWNFSPFLPEGRRALDSVDTGECAMKCYDDFFKHFRDTRIGTKKHSNYSAAIDNDICDYAPNAV